MFKRKIYQKMSEWKESSNGKTALLIEGARRVGKSTIVREFGKNEYRSYILIDFAFAPKAIRELFEDLPELDYLFVQLQLQYKTDLHSRESLIIFDEVQFCPKARQAIKVLVADGRYDYIETGSLISIRKSVEKILIPSEERKITLYPMDYEEFLWATGDYTTMSLLREVYDKKISLGDAQNRNLMRKFRQYMLVGGMPQAVQTFIDENNFRLVDEVKRDILALYEEDFYKIDPSGKISALFKAIPSELSKNASRYQVSGVLKNERISTVSEQISELVASKTVLPACQANDPNVGLAISKNVEKFKLYMTDTGLLVTLMFKDKLFTDNTIYSKLLSDKLPANLGILYENVVAQMLATRGDELYYYTFRDEVNRKNYQVDFIISKGSKVCPIEVKSSGYRVHRSLDEFNIKYSNRVLNSFLIYTKDLRVGENTIYLPVYLTSFI